MARRRRENASVNMSFLDIMSCGFGAIILFFVIIQHATVERTDIMTAEVSGEVRLLETEVALEQLNKVKLQNTIKELDEKIISSSDEAGLVAQILQTEEEELTVQELDSAARREHLNQLIADIQALEEEISKVKAAKEEAGNDTRVFFGQGDRQYLTGLRVGGERIMILLDSSASMLATTLVNVIRRKHLPHEQKIRAQKWQKALLTIDWITTQFPKSSQFQFYTFDTETKPVLPETRGKWIDIGEGEKLDEAVAAARRIAPSGGTSMHAAFEAINSVFPRPDNVFLIVDGLPTQGAIPDPEIGTVNSRQRERYFMDSLDSLPVGIPINVIMFPLEGDPMAASHFWKLAVNTGGSFMSPSRDWP